MNTKSIIQTISIITVAFAGTLSIHAESFDFKDPKGINNVSFTLDAPLESVSGTANGISGSIEFDPAHPENTKGEIVLQTSSLMVANSMMRDHLLGEHWMNVAEYPTITFVAEHFEPVKFDGTTVKAHATGTLSVKGVSKKVTVPVTLTYLPGKLSARTNGNMQGDLLVLRSTFSISRNDYGINAGQHEEKVSDEIELKLSIAGAFAK